MPNDKMYKIGVGVDKKSLDKIRKNLGDTIKPFEEAMKNLETKGFNSETKGQVKAELTALFKITEKQADALRDIVNGVVPSDDKNFKNLKQNVQDLTTFLSDAMQRMSGLGKADDWVKNGIGFVDNFVHMKGVLEKTLPVVDELKASVGLLTQEFSGFKDALARMNPDAFGKRFGAEVRATTDQVQRARSVISKLQQEEHKGIKRALRFDSYDGLTDYSGYDVQKIKDTHGKIEAAISKHLNVIDRITAEYTAKNRSPYGNEDYKEAVHGLFLELDNFKRLTNTRYFADAFPKIETKDIINTSSITAEITTAVDKMSQTLKDSIKEINDIQLSITLPDADAAEFASKINQFVSKAAEKFKENPVEVEVNFVSPLKYDAYENDGKTLKKLTDKQLKLSENALTSFKNAAEQSGVEIDEENLIGLKHKNVNKISRNILDAFTQMHKVMTEGQKLLKTSANKWRDDMSEAFTVKPKFDTQETKESIKNAILDLQEEFDVSEDEDTNFWVTAKPDTRYFIDDLQKALADKSVTVNVKAGEIDANGTPINFSGSRLIVDDIKEIKDPQSVQQTKGNAPSSSSYVRMQENKNKQESVASTKQLNATQLALINAIKKLDNEIKINNYRAEINDGDATEKNKPLEKYKASLEGVRDNNEDPIKLIVKELKSFWSSVKNGIEKATEDKDTQALNRWKAKEAAMIVKGLGITKINQDGTMSTMDDAEIEKIVRSVLKKNRTLDSNLLQDSQLKQSAYVKRIAYYAPIVQQSMGVKTQSVEEAQREEDLNESFKSRLKVNRYIQTARDLLSSKDMDLDPTAIQKFIDYFGHFPEMADAIEYAKKYLAEIGKITDEPWKNKDQKTYQQQIAELWGSLGKEQKGQFLNALNNSAAAAGKKYTVDDFDENVLYKLGIAAIGENGDSGLGQLSTNNPQLQQILAILQRSRLLNATRTSSRVFDDESGKDRKTSILPSLYGLQEGSGTVHASVIGRDGNERILELRGDGTSTASDKSYSYAPKSFNRFIRNSGVQSEIDELVTAMFDPALLLEEKLEAELTKLQIDLNRLKTGHPAYDAFDGTDLEENWKNLKNQEAINKSLREYLDTGFIDDRLFNEFKSMRGQAIAASTVRKIEDGKLPGYLLERIEGLNDADREAAIAAELLEQKSRLENYKSHNQTLALEELGKGEAALASFRKDHASAILTLITAKEQELAAKEEELKVASKAAEPAKQKVLEKTDALFNSGKFKLSAGNAAATPKWAQEEQFSKTALGEYEEKVRRTQKSLDAHRDGFVSQRVSNVMKTLNLSQEEALSRVVSMLENELAELIANPPSQEEIIKGLLVRAEDIERAKARSNKEASKSNKRERAAELMADEDNQSRYKHAVDRQKDVVNRSDYHLENLLSRINFATENALMDTNELNQLAEDYKNKLAATLEIPTRMHGQTTSDMASMQAKGEINALLDEAYAAWKNYDKAKKEFTNANDKFKRGEISEEDLQASGVLKKLEDAQEVYNKTLNKVHAIGGDINNIEPDAIQAARDAYEKLFAAKQALIDKFFGTEGWNVASALQDKLKALDGEFESKEREIRSKAANKNGTIQNNIAEIESKEASLKASADRYADNLRQTYILDPQEAVENALRNNTLDIANIKQETQVKKDALKNRAKDDKYLANQLAMVSSERMNDPKLKHLAQQRKKIENLQPAFNVFDELDKIADKYYTNPEISSLLATKQKMRDDGKSNTPQYSELLKTIGQKSQSYVDEVNLTIGRAIDQSIDKTKLTSAKNKVSGEKTAFEKELRVVEDLIAGKTVKYNDDTLDALQEKYAKADVDKLKALRQSIKTKVQSQDKELQIIQDLLNGNTKIYEDQDSKNIQKKLRNLADPNVKTHLEKIQNELGDKIPVKDSFLRSDFERQRNELQSSLNASAQVEADLNAQYDARIAAIKQLAEDDKVIHEQIKTIEDEWLKEQEPIDKEIQKAYREEGPGSDRYKELVAQRSQISAKYSKMIQEVEDKWIAEQAAKLDAAEKDALANLAKDSGHDIGDIFTKFNEMATKKLGREIKTQSYAEIEAIIQEIQDKAYKDAEVATVQAIANVDKSNEMTPADVEREIAAARAETEEKKRKAIEEYSKKTDAEIMAMRNVTASENLDKAAEESRQHAKALQEEQDASMQRYGITQEMLNDARQGVSVAKELAETREQESDTTKSSQPTTSQNSTPTGGGSSWQGSSLIGALDTSNLAKESTLRGIYMLLNGAPPAGGWVDDVLKRAISDDDFSDGTASSMGALASSIKGMVSDCKNYSVEVGYLVDKFGKVGDVIQGEAHKVPRNAFLSEVRKNNDKNIIASLHSHPTADSKHLSPGDVYSSYHRAYFDEKRIPVSGSISGDVISAIDWRDIDHNLARQIVERYAVLMDEWQSTMPDVFTYNEETKKYDANGDKIQADVELQKLISQKYNEILQRALSEFNVSGIYQQFNNPDDFATHLVSKAVQKVKSSVVEAGTQAAVKSAEIISMPDGDIDKTTTKRLADQINKSHDSKDGGFALSRSLFNISSLGVDSDSYKFDVTHSEKLATAYDQLVHGMDGTIKDRLDDSVKAYIEVLRNRLEEIAKANGLNYAEINKSIDERKANAKNIDGTRLTQETYDKAINDIKSHKDDTGSDRVQHGLKMVYDVLSNGKEKLTDKDIKKLGSGYFRLVETINHEISKKLNEDTQQLLIEARDAALDTLNRYGVKIYGSDELSGKIISEENKHLFNRQKTGPDGGIGSKFRSMTDPAIEITRKNDKGEDETVILQKAVGQIAKANEEKKKQKKLTNEVASGESQAAAAAEEHAQAVNKVTEAYKTSLTKETISSATSVLDGFTQTDKNGKVTKQAGVKRAKSGLKNVYSVLSKDTASLSNEDINTLKTGYEQLVGTIGHKIFENLGVNFKDVQQTMLRARDEALDVLKKYNVDLEPGKIDNTQKSTSSNIGGNYSNNSSDNKNNGGLLGILSGVAREDTLQEILGKISNGLKITSDKQNGSKKTGDTKNKDKSLNVTADDAWETAQDYIKKNYPDFTSLSALKPVSGGYSIDVFQPKNLEELADVQANINRLIAEGKQNTEEFSNAQEKLNGLKMEQEKITLKIGVLNDEVQVTQEKSGFQNLALGTKAASKELQNVEGILTQLHDIGALSLSDDGSFKTSSQVVQNYLNQLHDLESYRSTLSPEDLLSPTTEQKLSNFATDIKNARLVVADFINSVSQINIGEKIDTDKLANGIKELSDVGIKQLMQDIISDGSKLGATFGKLTPVTNELNEVIGYKLNYNLQIGKREVQEMTAYLNPLTNELRVQKGAVSEIATGWEKFFSGLKGKMSSIMQYVISITSINDLFRYARQGVEYIREIDSALTELKKVTNETDVTYSKFLQSMSKTAGVVGSTVSDLTTMAADWARLGYSIEEAGKLAESTAILLNVSEFQDATSASEALISTMQAFQYTADESQHVVDVLNEVGF